MTALAGGVAAAGTAAFVCYRSLWAFFLLMAPLTVVAPRLWQDMLQKKRQRELEKQFREMIQMMSTALSAGYSVDNAIRVCRRDLERMYGSGGMIVRETGYMVRQMEMNRPVEELLEDFALRSGLEEAENFTRIFVIARRSGGRLVSIIERTVQIMGDRSQVKEEIQTLTASKRFEQRIMNLIPVLMVLYIDWTSPGFFTVMYTTLLGRVLMTGGLLVYLASVWLAQKILDIEVGKESRKGSRKESKMGDCEKETGTLCGSWDSFRSGWLCLAARRGLCVHISGAGRLWGRSGCL